MSNVKNLQKLCQTYTLVYNAIAQLIKVLSYNWIVFAYMADSTSRHRVLKANLIVTKY